MGTSTAAGVINVSVIFTGEYMLLAGSLLLVFSLDSIVSGVEERDNDKLGDSNFLKVKDPLEIILFDRNLKFAKLTATPRVIV